ncbi:MAG TPA: AAA family ATPase [Planctomycetaceae bacterium]|nr:AAA family ATPase [Planctomycetaceae bacterium]
MSFHDSPLLIRRFGERLSATQLIETHISWVLLAGERAYKIKKPVDLGFVDFSTLERRRHFCQEELRLNRRLAPEIYREVLPITGTPDAPAAGGDGEPIEYAVVMRRFPQEALVSRVLERGELRPEHVDGLAAEIADFHSRVAVAGPASPFGTPESVRLPVEENFRHLDRIDSAAQSGRAQQLARLRAWSEREFAARRGDFVARKQAGFVRECHGDMHLGNMILEGGAVTIFDCIEFNESFRWIDVASELAFTVMDLADRGRPAYANRLLNAYLEATGEYEGLRVLPFYLTYRALVRAKVAALRLDQPGLSHEEQAILHDELDSYLALAEQSTQPRRPFLAITHGFSGSGKTRGTQCLVEEFGAVRIRSDVERKRLFGLQPLDRIAPARTAELYAADASRQTYVRLGELAGTVLGADFAVVVDATFLHRSGRDEFRALADRCGVPFLIVDFHAPERVLIERVSRRAHAGQDASDAGVDVLSQQLRSHEPLTADEQRLAIAVASTEPQSEALLIAAVRARTAGGHS